MKKSFKSLRLWVTSRPHLLEEVERSFGQLGYNIRAFIDADQIDFLSLFWKQDDNDDIDRFQLFAEEALMFIQNNVSQQDKVVAGIPLICKMIGEIHEKDAKEFAANTDKKLLQFQIKSIVDLYTGLIERKIH